MVKISVIIPLFNRENYIVETLKSVEHQQLTPHEVLVIDDRSTDRSVDVVRKYAEQSKLDIKIVSNERKKGQSGALNTGILKSSGDLIAFQDSDDLWMPGHLKQLVHAFSRYPQAGMAFSAIEIFGVAQDVGQKRQDFQASVKRCLDRAFEKAENGTWVSHQKLLSAILEFGFVFRCQAAVARKDFVLKHNLFFDEDISYTQDSQYGIFAAYCGPFIYVANIGTKIRRHEENDGEKTYIDRIAQNYGIRVLKLKKYFSDKRLNASEKRALQVRLWSLQEEVLRRQGMKGNALKTFQESWRLFYRVPCLRSVKSIIKTFIQKPNDETNAK